MTSIKVTVRQPLSNFKTGGLSPQKFEKLNKQQKIHCRLKYLESKANELIKEEHYTKTGAEDKDINIAGFELLRAVQNCKNVIDSNSTDAFDFFVNLGTKIANVNNAFMSKEVFKHEIPKAIGREKGGATTSAIRKAQGNETSKKVLNAWKNLSKITPRNRASRIAETLGITPQAVRSHLKILESEGKIKRT